MYLLLVAITVLEITSGVRMQELPNVCIDGGDTSGEYEGVAIPLFDTGTQDNITIELTVNSTVVDNRTMTVCKDGRIVYQTNTSNLVLSIPIVERLVGSELSTKSVVLVVESTEEDIKTSEYRRFEVNIKYDNIDFTTLIRLGMRLSMMYPIYKFHVITICDVLGICQFAIATAFHEEFRLNISLRLYGERCYVHFENQLYSDGDEFSAPMSRQRSLQIQSECDMTGTEISSNREITVTSGGVLTVVNGAEDTDTYMAIVPTLNQAGKEFAVFASKNHSNSYHDFVKILTTEPNTTLAFRGKVMILKEIGFLSQIIPNKGEVWIIEANKPIFVTHITWNEFYKPYFLYAGAFDKYFESNICKYFDSIIFKYKDLMNDTISALLTNKNLTKRLEGTEYFLLQDKEKCHDLSKHFKAVAFDSTAYRYAFQISESSGTEEESEWSDLDFLDSTTEEGSNDVVHDNSGYYFIFPLLKTGIYSKIELMSSPAQSNILTDKGHLRINKYTNGDSSSQEYEDVNGLVHYIPNTVIEAHSTVPVVLVIRQLDSHSTCVSQFLAIPSNVLGNTYIVGMMCNNDSLTTCSVVSGHEDASIKVVFPNSDNNLKVNVTVNGSTRTVDSITYTTILRRYSRLDITWENDLTGSKIIGNKFIGVFCGCNLMEAIGENHELDFYAIEQLPPIGYLGNEYVINTRPNEQSTWYNFAYKVVALSMFTTVSIKQVNNTVKQRNLDYPGQFFYETTSEPVSVEASKTILVLMKVITGQSKENDFFVCTPNSQARDVYTVPMYISNQFNDNTNVMMIGALSDLLYVSTLYPEDGTSIVTFTVPTPLYISNVYQSAFSGVCTGGQNFIKQEICVFGQEPDPDCDGEEKEELCVLHAYNEGKKAFFYIRLTTSADTLFAGSDASNVVDENIGDIVSLLSMGYPVQYRNRLQISLKSCAYVFIHMSSTYDLTPDEPKYRIKVAPENSLAMLSKVIGSTSNILTEGPIPVSNLCHEFGKFVLIWNNEGHIKFYFEDDIVFEAVDNSPFLIKDIGVSSEKALWGRNDITDDWIFDNTENTDKIFLMTPDISEDSNLDDNLPSESISLTQYGYRVDRERPCSFEVKACKEARLYLISNPDVGYAFSGITNMVIIKLFESYLEIASNSENPRQTTEKYGALDCSTYKKYQIVFEDTLVQLSKWNPDSLVYEASDSLYAYISDVSEIRLVTLGSDGYWIVEKNGPIFDFDSFIPDYDGDGMFDEDCEKQSPDCGYPEFENVEVTPLSTSGLFVISCINGYRQEGNSLTRCLPSGNWSKEFMCIQDNCLPPVRIDHTRLIDPAKMYKPGDIFQYVCLEGYKPTGNETIVCQQSGNWSETSFSCTVIQCARPDHPPNTIQAVRNNYYSHYEVGKVYEFQCLDGFLPSGVGTVTCLSNGTWTDIQFSCESEVTVTHKPECKCPCKNDLTQTEIKKIKEQMRQENLIDKKSVSNYKRKITSANDDRISAKAIGYIGATFLGGSCVVVVLLDAVQLANTVTTAFQNIKTLF